MSDIYKLLLLLLIILIILLCKNNKIKEYLTNIDNDIDNDINNDIFKIDKNKCSTGILLRKYANWPNELTIFLAVKHQKPYFYLIFF